MALSPALSPLVPRGARGKETAGGKRNGRESGSVCADREVLAPSGRHLGLFIGGQMWQDYRLAKGWRVGGWKWSKNCEGMGNAGLAGSDVVH